MNPYASSKNYNEHGYWADSFARSGKIKWLVFYGDELLAQVKGQTQAENLMRHLCGYAKQQDMFPDYDQTISEIPQVF